MYKVFFPKTDCNIIEIQIWLRENKIQHGPTQRMAKDGQVGWAIAFSEKEEAIAAKLRWI